MPMLCVAPMEMNEGNSLGQGYDRPTGCSAEKAPHATFNLLVKISTCPCPDPQEFSPRCPILFSLTSILILFFHPQLGLTSDLFLQVVNQTLYACLLVFSCHMPRQSHLPGLDNSNKIW